MIRKLRRVLYARWYRTAGMGYSDAQAICDRVGLELGILVVQYLRSARMCNDFALPRYRRQIELRQKIQFRQEYLRQRLLTKRD